MRWIWIDKLALHDDGVSATAVKNCTLAEDHVHDLYPDFPVVPNSLILEGFAQTAGVLVAEVRQYREKVILAKIGRATFHTVVRPGDTLHLFAHIDQLNDAGASVTGKIVARTALDGTAERAVADIEMMFSHVDQNLSGLQFPQHNFVFDGQMMKLIVVLRGTETVNL